MFDYSNCSETLTKREEEQFPEKLIWTPEICSSNPVIDCSYKVNNNNMDKFYRAFRIHVKLIFSQVMKTNKTAQFVNTEAHLGRNNFF